MIKDNEIPKKSNKNKVKDYESLNDELVYQELSVEELSVEEISVEEISAEELANEKKSKTYETLGDEFVYENLIDEATGSFTFKKDKVLKEIKGRYLYGDKSIKGGMGKITFVFDTFMNRNIVIKELISNKGDKNHKKKELGFLREALLTSELEHPSIIPIYEVGQKEDGKMYYSMKRIRGETLSNLVKDKKSVKDRLSLLPNFLNICYAIAYSHEKDIIHRDIKPQNIMIDKFGETILLDWGLARNINIDDSVLNIIVSEYDTKSDKTISGSIVGTPSYMSPEQAKGEKLDKRSDVYSLGAVLYYILAARPAFEANSVSERLKKVINEEPLPIVNDEIPKDLIAITKKAMAKNKEERYRDISDLIEEIKRYLSGDKVMVYHYSFWEIIKKTAKSNSVAFASIIIIFITLVISFILVFNSYKKEKRAIKNFEITLKKEKKANREATYNYSVSLLQKSLSLINEKRINEAEIYASKLISYASKGKENNDTKINDILKEAKSVLYQANTEANFEFKGVIKNSSNIYKLVTSKDGKYLISAGRDGFVNVWDLKDYTKVFEKKFDSFIISVDITKNSENLVVVEKKSYIHIWNFKKNKQIIKKFIPIEEQIYIARYSFKDKYLITSGKGKDIIFRNPLTLDEITRIPTNKGIVFDVVIAKNKDNELLITSDFKDNIILWNIKTKEKLFELKEINSGIRAISLFNNNENLIVSLQNGKIKVWSLITGKFIREFENHENFKVSMGLFNKKYLVGIRELLTVWDTETGKVLSRMKINELTAYSALALTNKNIFTSSFNKDIKIWKLNINDKYEYKINNKIAIDSIALSNDKKYLSVLRDDNKLLLYDFRSHKLIRSVIGEKLSVFSEDSKSLATTFNNKILLYVIDKKNRKIIRKDYFQDNKEFILSLLFLRKNILAVSTSSGNIYLLDLSSNTIVNKLISNNIKKINFMSLSDDARFLASSGLNKNIDIWNLETNKLYKVLKNKNWETVVHFTKKNKVLTSGRGKIIKLWNVNNSKIEKTFIGNKDWTTFLKVSPDKKNFITISDDNTLKFWNVKNESYLLSFKLSNLRDVIFKDNDFIIIVQDNKLLYYPFVFSGFYKDKNFYENKSQLKLDGFNIIAQ